MDKPFDSIVHAISGARTEVNSLKEVNETAKSEAITTKIADIEAQIALCVKVLDRLADSKA